MKNIILELIISSLSFVSLIVLLQFIFRSSALAGFLKRFWPSQFSEWEAAQRIQKREVPNFKSHDSYLFMPPLYSTIFIVLAIMSFSGLLLFSIMAFLLDWKDNQYQNVSVISAIFTLVTMISVLVYLVYLLVKTSPVIEIRDDVIRITPFLLVFARKYLYKEISIDSIKKIELRLVQAGIQELSHIYQIKIITPRGNTRFRLGLYYPTQIERILYVIKNHKNLENKLRELPPTLW